jgi:hypothetical protein
MKLMAHKKGLGWEEVIDNLGCLWQEVLHAIMYVSLLRQATNGPLYMNPMPLVIDTSYLSTG